jgi:hypothetical protein
MPSELTPEQEAFCRHYLALGNAAEAYRRAYPRTVSTRRKKLCEYARRLRKRPQIAARIAELRPLPPAAVLELSQEAIDVGVSRAEPPRNADGRFGPAAGRESRAPSPDLTGSPKPGAELSVTTMTRKPAGPFEPDREILPALGVAPLTGCVTDEAPAAEFRDWERLVLLAFDNGLPDLVRLAALRCLTAGLEACQVERGASLNGAETIAVTLTVGCGRRFSDKG